MRYVSVLALFLGVAACDLTQRAEQRANTMPATPLSTAAAITDLGQLESAQRSAKGESTVRILAAIKTTLTQDPSTLAARLNVQQSINAAARAQNKFRPTVSLDASQFFGDDLGASLRITQPLYDFGKRNAARRQDLAEAGLKSVELRMVQTALGQRMLAAAVNAQEARALIALNKRRIAAFKDALARAKRLSELNLVTASDLRLTEVRLNAAQKDLEASQIALSAAEREWRQLTGGRTSIPKGALFPGVLNSFKLTSATKTQGAASQHNLELADALAKQSIAQQSLENANVNARPTINAVSATRLGSGTGKRTNLGLTVDFPLYSRDQRDSESEAAETVAIQIANVTQIRRDIGFQVADTWVQISDLKRLARLERESIKGLEDRYEALLAQINTGLTSFDKVIEAQTELFDTEVAALGNRFDADRAAINLLTLSGVLAAP